MDYRGSLTWILTDLWAIFDRNRENSYCVNRKTRRYWAHVKWEHHLRFNFLKISCCCIHLLHNCSNDDSNNRCTTCTVLYRLAFFLKQYKRYHMHRHQTLKLLSKDCTWRADGASASDWRRGAMASRVFNPSVSVSSLLLTPRPDCLLPVTLGCFT